MKKYAIFALIALEMKRIILSILLGFYFLSLYSQVEKISLIEEFTNNSSTPCAIQNSAFNSLINSNSGRSILITYHTNWPGKDEMYTPASNEITKRSNFYNVTGVPFSTINGKAISGNNYSGAAANLSQRILDETFLQESPVEIIQTHAKSEKNDSIFIRLVLKALQPITGNNSLFLAIAEHTIELKLAPGNNGETDFHNVIRRMLPDANGKLLPGKIDAGDSIVLNYRCKMADMLDPMQVCVIAWIQNISTKSILQAAWSKPVGPEYHDAAIVSVDYPEQKLCGNAISPKVVIQNFGDPTLNNLDILYSINSEPPTTYAWSGSLDFLEKQKISLPALIFTALPNNNMLKIVVKNPNSNSDNNPYNDSIVSFFDASASSGSPVKLELQTDQYPCETSWKIINSSGQIVNYGGNYTTPNSLISKNIELPTDECYTFILSDQGGDGICCKYSNGFFQLRNQSGQIIAEGSKFGNEVTVPFRITEKEIVEDLEIITDFQVFPNPFDNNATISIFISRDMNVKIRVLNEMGQIVFSQDNEALPAGNHTYELNGDSWAPGIYVVKVITGDKLLTRKLTLTK